MRSFIEHDAHAFAGSGGQGIGPGVTVGGEVGLGLVQQTQLVPVVLVELGHTRHARHAVLLTD